MNVHLFACVCYGSLWCGKGVLVGLKEEEGRQLLPEEKADYIIRGLSSDQEVL